MNTDGDSPVEVLLAGPHAALQALVDREPERHDLVFGLVGAIGTPWEPIQNELADSLQQFGYSAEVIHVAGLLDDLDQEPYRSLPPRDSYEYYERRMDAGDLFRRTSGTGSAMAALAIREIAQLRLTGDTSKPRAYILRSIKHPEEVRLLRHTYGRSFFLVGAVCSAKERRENLSDALSLFENHQAQVADLILRDQSDPTEREFGQNVQDSYVSADVFIRAGRGLSIRNEVDRFIGTIFGEPYITPNSDEEAMYFANSASYRSAAAGRQVGAALIPMLGTPIVAGSNEVPRPGGGQYWEGDTPDFRDHKLDQDPNASFIRELLRQLIDRLKSRDWLSQPKADMDTSELLELAIEDQGDVTAVLGGTRVASLIEFTRCLHAEQAAITNAARVGVSTEGAQLYSTTFPCHECAKMIVGAGISRVVYIAPYPKSLVDRLYRDLVDTSPDTDEAKQSGNQRLPFHQFTGIAPEWYRDAFVARNRKVGSLLVTFNRSQAHPQTSDWNQRAVSERESGVVEAIGAVVQQLPHLGDIHEDDRDADLRSSGEDSKSAAQ